MEKEDWLVELLGDEDLSDREVAERLFERCQNEGVEEGESQDSETGSD